MQKSRVLALVTARGNNTLKDKNILLVNGRPVITYPIQAALRSELCTDFYASSDCPKILNICTEYGFHAIKRPSHLALPNSLHYDAIIHALNTIELSFTKPDFVVVLLGNSVTVKSQWIDDCINLIQSNDCISAVVPVIQDNDHHPYRCKKISHDGSLVSFVETPADTSSNRQDLEPALFLAHNFWVLRTAVLYDIKLHGMKPWPFMGSNVHPYIVNEAFDIHSIADLSRASTWLDSTKNEQ